MGRAFALALVIALSLACSVADEDAAVRSAPGGAEPGAAAHAPPRVILLISIDTLRADHLGLYGHARFTSPILDGFARSGVVFEDASAPAPWTLPSHASILTGRYPLRHGVTSSATALPEDVATLAKRLSGLGYRTAAITNSAWLKADSFRLTADFDVHRSVTNRDYSRRSPSTLITDQVMDWLKEEREQKLFVFMHNYDVHADYASTPEYERLFVDPAYTGAADGSGWQLQVANFAPEHVALCLREFDPAFCAFGSSEKPRLIDGSLPRLAFDAADVEHMRRLYDAGIRQLDTELGRLFVFLDEQGLSEETLVVVTSDHGEEFMEHGRVDHFLTLYQESVRVPLLLRGPGVPAGARIAVPVSSVDIAPTLVALAGGGDGAAKEMDGLDLSVLWRSGDASAFEGRVLYGEAAGGLQYEGKMAGVYPIYWSVRRGPFKLVHDSNSGEFALFDLDSDPGERTDVAAAHPALFEELERVLLARRAAFDLEPTGPAVELDPQEIEELRALGYVP